MIEARLLLLEVRGEHAEAGWLGGPQFQARSFLQVGNFPEEHVPARRYQERPSLHALVLIPRLNRNRRMELKLEEYVSSLRARRCVEYNAAS